MIVRRYSWILFAVALAAPCEAVAGLPFSSGPQTLLLGRLEADSGAVGARPTYRQGQQALDAGRWEEAAEIFRHVAAANGSDADAALYWRAYALAKAGEKADALAAVRDLRSTHPESAWLDDAQALEIELRGPKSGAAADSAAESEELKLYALNGLMHADPERAIPVLKKFLEGDASPRLKKQALFVLGQSDSAEARQLLEAVATGRSNPGLQREAIQMLGIAGGDESVATLARIYRESPDPKVKEAVLHAYLVADAEEQVLAIARDDADPDTRRKAIHQLGAMGAGGSLRQLYSSEKDVKVRRSILEAMGIAGDTEALAQAARTETDPGLRRAAIHGLGITDEPAAGAALERLYASHTDEDTRKAVIEALFIQSNTKALISLFRAEKDPGMRREIVQKLSLMDSPEATDLLLEMLDQ